ncbi:hypothetical protein [Cupriavidus sp. EM10]|uniref:hypothetical protein n=1 Tax=Cupriavidus sp. EM10 TaxID=2839983 RepID=UPI001BFFF963|nr:hypothetical protein [Cupriavidus sp. EM10]QWE95117.1 hypothetical protein KLP38_04005 [Cupriavidus sp. EM10]
METGTAPGSGAPGATGAATAPAVAGTAPGRFVAGNARDSPAPALAGGAMAGSIGDEGMAALEFNRMRGWMRTHAKHE